MISDLAAPRPVLCKCGHKLFDIGAGRFEFFAGWISCSQCRERTDIEAAVRLQNELARALPLNT